VAEAEVVGGEEGEADLLLNKKMRKKNILLHPNPVADQEEEVIAKK
jgi:hypothetical protein